MSASDTGPANRNSNRNRNNSSNSEEPEGEPGQDRTPSIGHDLSSALVVFLTVEDLDRSASFYRDQLGLPLVLEQAHCRIYKVAEGGYVGTCTAGQRPLAPDGVVVTLVRDDVDEYCARLVAAGVTLEQEPTHTERFAIYNAFLRDPDGHLVEVQRFDAPDWSEPVDHSDRT